MEKDFTADEFARMQQQAIRRVKEMQQRSKDREAKNEQAVLQNDKKVEKQLGSALAKPPRLQMKNENNRPKSMISSLFNMDSDVSLLLPLLLLLSKEGTDDMLLLALLYIMS